MKVLLVAHDTAPSAVLARLASELRALGLEVLEILGHGKPLMHSYADIEKSVLESQAVVLGMSSSEELSKEEIHAARTAFQEAIPYGFYADTYDCQFRPWFDGLKSGASFLFVINQEEGRKAKKLFHRAEIVVSGNPLWEDFHFPRVSYEEVRQRFGVKPEEIMVLCPGGKSLAVNMLHFSGVIEAVGFSKLSTLKRCKIFLALHPGDLNSKSAYDDLVAFSPIPVVVITKEVMSVSDLVSGSDMVVESASTVGIEAAHQRKPVINYFSELALQRLEKVSGSREWMPCKLGVAAEVRGSPQELGLRMYKLLIMNEFIPMRIRQEEMYPRPSVKGTALRLMREVIMHKILDI